MCLHIVPVKVKKTVERNEKIKQVGRIKTVEKGWLLGVEIKKKDKKKEAGY